MSENGIRMARFDHVSEKGELVFVCDHRHFAVPVDDALDHAILEAKQVKEEEEGAPRPQASTPLPVSSIQAAVRAGARPANVAQQFAVNEAIVRRFAAPVETEKKYAIEQFLTMQAPKGSAGHTNQDLIAKVLRQADASMKDLTWEATRRGYEPWMISGVIQLDKLIINAQWSWNMRDNTVTCLNDAARTLLDQSSLTDLLGNLSSPTQTQQADPEQVPETEPIQPQPEMTGPLQDSFGTEQALPIQNTAPIENPIPVDNPVTSTPMTAAEAIDNGPLPTETHESKSGAGNDDRHSALTAWLYGKPSKEKAKPRETPRLETTPEGLDDETKHSLGQPAASVPLQEPMDDDAATRIMPTQEPVAPQFAEADTPQQTEETQVLPRQNQMHQVSREPEAQPNQQARVSQRKHSGRSAVPSWDEILFGD